MTLYAALLLTGISAGGHPIGVTAELAGYTPGTGQKCAGWVTGQSQGFPEHPLSCRARHRLRMHCLMRRGPAGSVHVISQPKAQGLWNESPSARMRLEITCRLQYIQRDHLPVVPARDPPVWSAHTRSLPVNAQGIQTGLYRLQGALINKTRPYNLTSFTSELLTAT